MVIKTDFVKKIDELMIRALQPPRSFGCTSQDKKPRKKMNDWL